MRDLGHHKMPTGLPWQAIVAWHLIDIIPKAYLSVCILAWINLCLAFFRYRVSHGDFFSMLIIAQTVIALMCTLRKMMLVRAFY